MPPQSGRETSARIDRSPKSPYPVYLAPIQLTGRKSRRVVTRPFFYKCDPSRLPSGPRSRVVSRAHDHECRRRRRPPSSRLDLESRVIRLKSRAYSIGVRGRVAARPGVAAYCAAL
eukprot:2386292-Prymnesium_polylepis.1